MSTKMRAKMKIMKVDTYEANENLQLSAIGPSGSYPDDGSDENNTFAKFTPSATLEISIANPALRGQFKVGDTFYVDFTPTE